MSAERAAYFRVLATFARNSLVRDMTYRANFLLDAFTSLVWMAMNLGFYLIVFTAVEVGGRELDIASAGWGRYQFFVFIATTMILNSLVQAFFMPNVSELSELIRTGNLDFALLKPIDTQFLISLQKIEWSSLANTIFGGLLLAFSLTRLGFAPTPLQYVLYPFYILCGLAILYSLMIALGAASVWLGRNQSLYDFWFYITNFSRYPQEIYRGRFGTPLRLFFTYAIPILVVVNVPARILAQPLDLRAPGAWQMPAFAIVAALGSLLATRWLFQRALRDYRSASS